MKEVRWELVERPRAREEQIKKPLAREGGKQRKKQMRADTEGEKEITGGGGIGVDGGEELRRHRPFT